jgi:membrane-associated phospholipid phosphatase
MTTVEDIGVRWSRPAVVALGLVVALAALVVLEVTGVALSRPDTAVLDWMLTRRTAGLTRIAVPVTDSGASPVLFPLVAVTGVLVGLRTKRWWPGLAALAVVVTGVLSRLALATVVGDARPPLADRLVAVEGFSFPSGHAATSALVAGALSWLLWQLVRGRPGRLAIVAALGAWALLVALSRMYLGVHWVSDVLGSWLLAGAWLAVLLTAAAHLRRRPGPGAG